MPVTMIVTMIHVEMKSMVAQKTLNQSLNLPIYEYGGHFAIM